MYTYRIWVIIRTQYLHILQSLNEFSVGSDSLTHMMIEDVRLNVTLLKVMMFIESQVIKSNV